MNVHFNGTAYVSSGIVFNFLSAILFESFFIAG